MSVKTIVSELRVKHYMKNALVFLPLVFSLRLTEYESALRALLAFLAFCAGSSAIYAVNDIKDRSLDALDERKSKRPIASGAMKVSQGYILSSVCFAASVLLAVSASPETAAHLLVYIAINAAYCLALKNVAIIDVFCLAAGFMLRVSAGAAAVGVPVSDWLLLTILSLSLFLGFGKRRGEMRGEKNVRKVLSSYSVSFLDKAMYSMMTLSVAFYTLWSIDKKVADNLGTDKLVWSVPIVIAALLRYSQRVEDTTADGDPTNIILSDKPVLIMIAAYIMFVVIIIYIF